MNQATKKEMDKEYCQPASCINPPVRVHVLHKENCDFTSRLLDRVREEVPEAKIQPEVNPEGTFEYFVNEKIVWSESQLGRLPKKPEELVEITRWAHRGKSFMHMYLCTVADGGEPNMVVADRKNTPLAKRLILACVIS